MRCQQIPYCCGAATIFGFAGDPGYVIRRLDSIINHPRANRRFALYSCILADRQQGEYGHVVKAFGFKEVATRVNPNSGNMLHYYVYTRP
jgi:hypothetical protein